MYPRISGGTRAMFSKEFRERFSRVISASKARMKSMLISRPILMARPTSGSQIPHNVLTYVGGDVCVDFERQATHGFELVVVRESGP